jgi:hypothetical protein
MEPQTRYAKTADGVHIAYQVRGAGSHDVVWIPTFVSNFEVDFELGSARSTVDATSSSPCRNTS